jgi:uncharacterized protein (TIGR02996 family)
MSDAAALLSAVRADPDDVDTRLVYADWLIDQGDPLGEFIHLQCAPHDEARKRRENELLRLHGDEWLAPLRAVVDADAIFVRGFVERVHLAASAFLAHGDQLFDLLPALREVAMTEAGPVVDRLAACPALRRVRRLLLHDNHLDDGHAAILFASPHLRDLIGLDLSNNQITAAGVRALGAAGVPALRHLDLSFNPCGEAEFEALVVAASLRKLVTLRLHRSGQTIDDFVPLLRSPLRDALTEDTLASVPASGRLAPLLAEAARARGMKELRLTLYDDAAEALASSPHLGGVTSLRLSSSSLTGDALATLLSCPSLTALESLDLAFMSQLGDRGARALAEWPGLAKLSFLDLNGVGVTSQGVAVLAASQYAGGLRRLLLANNTIGDAGAEAIALSKTLTALTELSLFHCGVGDRGVSALAESANVVNVEHLDLHSNKLTDEAVRKLAGAARLARLRSLNLQGNAITDGGGRALAASEQLLSLQDLLLAECVFSHEVRRALVARYGDGVRLTGPAEPDEQAEARRPFLRAIAELPDEDGPRLTFADWLQASDPERAELIRLQCELARLAEGDPRREELLDREQELLSRNMMRWCFELPQEAGLRWDWLGDPDNVRVAFDRGLVRRVSINNDLAAQLDVIAGVTVPRSLAIGWDGNPNAIAVLPRLRPLHSLKVNVLGGASLSPLLGGALAGVRELDLEGNPLTDADLTALAESAHLGRLEKLNLSSTGAAEGGVAALVRSPYLPRLRELRLAFNYQSINADVMRVLFSSGRRGLESLILNNNGLRDDALAAMARGRGLPDLKALDLEENYPTRRGLTALFTSPVMMPVRSLRVPNFQECQGALVALAASPYARNLTHLDLDNLDVDLDDFTALAASENLPELRELDVGQVYVEAPEVIACFIDAPLTRQLARFYVHLLHIEAGDLRRLLESLTPGRLRSLRLCRCQIGDEGARVLAESPALSGLRELDLFENGIGPAGAEALAKSPYLENLTDLGLSTNAIGSHGASALASSVQLHNLRALNLRSCDIGTPGARAIANAWRWRRLAWLDLDDNRIGTAGGQALAATETLQRLICLRIGQNQVGPTGIEALEASPRLILHDHQRPA